MKQHWIYRTMIGLILIPPLISCGDGDKNLAGGGIGGTGISVGAITGFGSVFVNGIEFNTDNAEIYVDGDAASESDLGIGMVIAVKGTFDENGLTGTADRITYEELVEGPVDNIDLDEETLIVLGRTILLSDGTVFDGVSLETLLPGSIVEVSGQMKSSGEVVATRIELKSGITGFEITGMVKNLDDAGKTFTIENVTIDYNSAVLDDDLPGGMLSNGLLVEVESTAGLVDGVLIANRIEPQESALDDAEGLRVEIEGIVTDFTSLNEFEVNGIPVRTDSETTYEHGFASDIALDVKVEVEGSVVGGVLDADEIEFRVKNAVEIEANVQEVDPINKTLVLLGITANVNNLTVFRDNSDAKVRPFGLGNIQIDDELEVSGILENSAFIATSVLRVNPISKVSLEGPVTAVSDPTFEILGVSVMTSGETEFMDSNEMPLTPLDFFSTVDIGSVVGAEGILTEENVIIADEVEFEE
jgi:hypothetical protein